MLRYVVFMLMLVPMVIFADSRSIDKSLLKDLSSFTPTDKDTVIQGMLYNQPLDEAALNPEVLKQHNKYFTHEITTGRITNQNYSGRCWLFAALNMLRPNVVEIIKDEEFEFSQNYLFFYDKLEKSNTFLELVITRADLDIRDPKFQFILSLPWDGPIQDGGYWDYAITLIEKYGAVPFEVMPDNESALNPDAMNSQLTQKLMLIAYAMKKDYEVNKSRDRMREMKKKALKDIYKILALHLGKPPVEFDFVYKNSDNDVATHEKHTPMSFAKKYVTSAMDDFVAFSYYPSRPFNTLYEGENSNYLIDGKPIRFINLDMKVLKEMVLKSVLANNPVDFSAIFDYQIDNTSGIMHPDLYRYDVLYGIDMNGTNVEKGLMGLIDANHDLVILGVDVQGDKVIKWKVENSWGDEYGDSGIYFMYDGWMDKYVDGFIINKKFISPEILKILNQKPVVIPEDQPWR